MFRLFALFVLLFTAYLPCSGAAEEGRLEVIVDKLELYNQDATGKDFIKFLSWSYSDKLEENLNDFIEELEPTIIVIQNITKKKLDSILQRNIMRFYAYIYDKNANDQDIINPIFFKGDRIQPVLDKTGVLKKETNGQVRWARFKVINLRSGKVNRERRDLKPRKSFVASLWRSLDLDDCVPGTIVIANANLKDVKANSQTEFLNTIYKDVLCGKRAKILFAGNVGWTKTHPAIFKFGKRMMDALTFNVNNKRNLNQIWANDFYSVRGIQSNIMAHRDNDVTKKVTSYKDMIIAPTFAVFHYEPIQTE